MKDSFHSQQESTFGSTVVQVLSNVTTEVLDKVNIVPNLETKPQELKVIYLMRIIHPKLPQSLLMM